MSRGMSRGKTSRLPALAKPKPRQSRKPGKPASFNTVQIAEEIGMEALDMAKRAQAAGLPTLGFLLESVALEAAAQADAATWPRDMPER